LKAKIVTHANCGHIDDAVSENRPKIDGIVISVPADAHCHLKMEDGGAGRQGELDPLVLTQNAGYAEVRTGDILVKEHIGHIDDPIHRQGLKPTGEIAPLVIDGQHIDGCIGRLNGLSAGDSYTA